MTNSTLNTKLAKVSDISFTAVENVTTSVIGLDGSGGPIQYEKTRVYFNTITTGNSDKFSVDLGFKQPSNKKDPYQVQYRSHSRYTLANAKKKGATWTALSPWKNLIAITGVSKDSTANPDGWNASNLGINKSSSYLIFYKIRNSSIGSDFDARSYQFRIRTYNKSTNKHGAWVYSTYLKVYKAPRIADVRFFVDDSGGLILKCNIRYGERGGTFRFDGIIDNRANRNLLKNDKPVKIKMINDTTRTAQSDPPRRDGFIPASCRIPVDKLKRGISPGERLWIPTVGCVFIGNDNSGEAQIMANYSTTLTKKLGYSYFKRVTVSTRDITINTPRLVLGVAEEKGFVEARLYKSDANDTVEAVGATLYYTYPDGGKTYSVKPQYTALSLTKTSTTECIARWIFTKCPFGCKLAVSATASNSYGSSQKVSKSVTIDYPYWFIQSETNPSRGAVLQWNVNFELSAGSNYTLELPYGRKKPFVAFGKGLTKAVRISGEVPTQTQSPIFNSTYANRDTWMDVQANPGIYIVRGPNRLMYRMAIIEVGLSEKANSEILSVSVRGVEIE